MESKRRMVQFDQLELLSLTGMAAPFPAHCHDTFCISLVHRGVEVIEMEGRKIYTTAGHISINNPGEVHANPLLEADTQVSFDTLYLSQDLVDHICGQVKIRFANVQPFSHQLNKLFLRLVSAINAAQAKRVAILLGEFLPSLQQVTSSTPYPSPWPSRWEELSKHLHMADDGQKTSLEDLARIVGMNKFTFARQFKAEIGMSPMHYLLMRRVFKAKQAIHSQSNLTDLAYEYGFADQAHFSRNFTRFVGVSPREFKKGKS